MVGVVILIVFSVYSCATRPPPGPDEYKRDWQSAYVGVWTGIESNVMFEIIEAGDQAGLGEIIEVEIEPNRQSDSDSPTGSWRAPSRDMIQLRGRFISGTFLVVRPVEGVALLVPAPLNTAKVEDSFIQVFPDEIEEFDLGEDRYP